MATNLTSAEILAAAADLVEFSGEWRQNGSGNDVCLMTSIEMVSPWSENRERAREAVCREVGVPTVGGWQAFDWNDAPGRTKEEVANVLRNSKRHLPTDEASA